MAAEGFFRIPFSKKDGGLGLSYPACGAAVMAEELAYISASVAGTINAHFLLSGKTLAMGSPHIKEKISCFGSRRNLGGVVCDDGTPVGF